MRTRSWIAAIWFLLLPAGSRAELNWNVLESSPDRIVLELRVQDASLEDLTPAEGQHYRRVHLPGAIGGGEPGLPMLPHALHWALLPPDGSAELHVLSAEFAELGRGRLLPRPVPGELIEGPKPGQAVTSERLLEAEGYGSFRLAREQAFELGESIFMARQHMVPLRVRPVLYDAATERIEILRRARLEIRIGGGDARPEISSASGPAAVGRHALNAEMAERWRGLPAAGRAKQESWSRAGAELQDQAGKRADGVLPFDATTLESDEIRLRIPTSRLWQVPVGVLLQSHGIPLDTPRSHLRLYQRRMSDPDDALYPTVLTVDVPFHMYGNPDPAQNVSLNDLFVFYGLGASEAHAARDVGGTTFPAAMTELPENYNNDNVYFLALVDPGAGAWSRMTRQALGASGGSPQASFAAVDHFEKDQGYQDNPKYTSEPRYHWNSANQQEAVASLNLRTPAPGTSFDITATVTRAPVFNNADRFVRFTLTDGSQSEVLQTINVRSTVFATLQPISWTRPAVGWQHDRLQLRMTRDNPSSFLSTYLGSVEVAYDAVYLAGNNRLEFDSGQVGGTVDVEVPAFTTGNLMLVELTDPYAPVWIDLAPANLVDPGDGSTTLSIQLPQQAGEKRRFSVLPTMTAPEVLIGNDTETDPVPEVLTATGPAQVLAIGPAEFAAATDEWLQWRSAKDRNGWTYRYVDVQQIYDDFSGGLKDPGAIKEFLQYYYVMHDARAVLLVGDGNENARELGTLPSRDIIPPSLHVQTISSFDELLASDKWFVMFDLAGTGYLNSYPSNLNKGPDMLIGRFTVNTVSELQTQIAKLKRYEAPTETQLWRSRTFWIADDAYSTSVIGAGQGCYEYWDIEDEFLVSQQFCADTVANSLDGAIEAEVWHLEDVTKDLRVPIANTDCFDLTQTRANANVVFPDLTNSRLSEGWLWVSYQGHANFDVLAHENMLLLQWLRTIGNLGTPFVFFGMGCHVTDFLRAKESAEGKTIGEALLNRPSGGAIATYGSSGFEYLSPNSAYMKLIARNFFELPRATSSVLDPAEFESPWIFAEAMAQSELDIVTLFGPISSYREMMAQYNLLGDPLLRMDALPARIAARADGSDLADGAVLATTGSQRSIQLELDIVDETALGRAEILDIEPDADLSDGIQPSEILRSHSAQFALDPIASDSRRRTGQLNLPISAQDYKVLVEIYDGSYPDERPGRTMYEVPMPLTLFVNDEEVPDFSGVANGQTVDVRVEFVPPIELRESEIQVLPTDADISGLNAVDMTGDGRRWELSFRLHATADRPRVELDLAGAVTELKRRGGLGRLDELLFTAHYPFPNPTPGPVRIVGELSRVAQSLELSVFDLSGRPVYQSRSAPVLDADNRFVLEWDGRDKMGDELANGVYLYRLDARAGGVTAQSDMGRLVFMR